MAYTGNIIRGLFDPSGAFMYHFSPRGQGLAEYALVILLVGITVIVLVALFGSGVGNMFSNIIANF
jgi:Flp pilus assembly pilin Flp